MKIKLIILSSLLLLASAYTCVAQVGPSQPNGPVGNKNVPNKPPPTFSKLPDLIVTSVKAKNDDLDGGEVVVVVKNQGNGQADSTSLSLYINDGASNPVIKSASEPALGSGKTATIVVYVGGLAQLNVCAKADGANKITETNEKNNKSCTKFGGKP